MCTAKNKIKVIKNLINLIEKIPSSGANVHYRANVVHKLKLLEYCSTCDSDGEKQECKGTRYDDICEQANKFIYDYYSQVYSKTV